jgi:hypothetical protein
MQEITTYRLEVKRPKQHLPELEQKDFMLAKGFWPQVFGGKAGNFALCPLNVQILRLV